MSEQDVATRRARDLERYHCRTAERRAKGLCLKCGKQPPAPHRTQCEPCAEKQRAGDLARYHRRTAERVAQGLCPKCGKAPPEPGRSQCGPCLAKDAAAGRARDARLRAAGMPRRDPGKARIAERRRRGRQIAERRTAGLCPECGEAPPAPGRTVCEPCGEARRATARARYAKGKAGYKCATEPACPHHTPLANAGRTIQARASCPLEQRWASGPLRAGSPRSQGDLA